MTQKPDILIIGAGLSGLICAKILQEKGVPYLLVEKSDGIGGRIRTDEVNGFRLDRGFQVLLTAYPQVKKHLNLNDLDLRLFYSGAWVHAGRAFQKVGDPKRHREDLLPTMMASIGRFSDKLRVLKMRKSLLSEKPDDIFEKPNMPTIEALRQRWHFSESMIEMFFRPFLGGILLDHSLRSSARMAEFVLRMFAEGSAAVPAKGMQAIPEQLASALPANKLRLNTAVTSISGKIVTLNTGEVLHPRWIVVATDGAGAGQLLKIPKSAKYRGVITLYFAADRDPVGKPVLVLEGEPKGPVNHLVSMSAVSKDYAPEGKVLLSVTVLDHQNEKPELLEAAVLKQLRLWFKQDLSDWTLLKIYHIPAALPDQRTELPFSKTGFKEVSPDVFMCGDHQETGSIEGALTSGVRTAEALIERWEQSTIQRPAP
ncbi:MAG: FAD-dependent oxidoreductase [Bacteroidetes Order II. Incertae sedis bacterium]|nr:FAD-dependent oxidoreductase [Bacteroidetes Order II. bacterium]